MDSNDNSNFHKEAEPTCKKDDQKSIRDVLCKLTPRPLIFFDVEVTEHCNLNCRGCGSLAPLAEEEYLDVERYEKDLARLSYLADGEMHHINILGGEPLLHPEIKRIISLTRQYFGYGNIYLVTNGILLPKMDQAFWECCRENDVIVAPTKYPIALDYDAIEKTARGYGVKYTCFGDVPAHGWNHYVFVEKGDRNDIHQFLKCSCANACTVLKDGKLYPCPRPAKIHHFNKAFQTNIKVSRRDYIDIYDEKIDLEAIMKFLSRPIPFCRYCNNFTATKQEWGVSKKQIEEWI